MDIGITQQQHHLLVKAVPMELLALMLIQIVRHAVNQQEYAVFVIMDII